MEPVRVGIIGCGVIGTHHLRTATTSPLVKLVAVADLIEPNRQRAAEQFKPERVYASGEGLLADDEVEAVVLAFPTQHRTEMALQAFEHGKHVLIEKPVAMNAQEVEQMIITRGNLLAGCCSCRYRFTESARVATEFIASGALGELRMVRCRELRAARERPKTPGPAWRLIKAFNGGGILVNWGCYDLDYLLGITGWSLKPKAVFAQTWTTPPPFVSHVAAGSDAETHYIATVLCQNNISLSVERGEFMTAQSEADWQVIGTKGALKLRMTDPHPKSIVFDQADAEQGTISKPPWEGDTGTADIHTGPLTDFAEAIRKGRQPKTSLEQALIIQKITDAIYASAAQQAVTEIP